MPEISSLSEESQKLVDMFYVTLFNKFIEFDEQDYNEKGILKNNVDSIANVKDNLSELFKREYLKQEIIELLEYRRTKIDLFSPEIDLDYESPLQLYCSYSRDQILASFKSHKLLKEGVVYLKQYKTDILLVTLSKTEKEYSEKQCITIIQFQTGCFTGNLRIRHLKTLKQGKDTSIKRVGTTIFCCS